MKSKDKKKEFSKIILVVDFVVCSAVIVFSGIMIAVTKDMSPLAYLIPAVFGELATATAFYFNKAKAENELKLMNEYSKEEEKQG